MQRLCILLFGAFAYTVFLATAVSFVVFVGNLQLTPLADFVPLLKLFSQSLDVGPTLGKMNEIVPAVLMNVLLITLFGMQHSIMARSGFKEWLHRSLPSSAERSVFVLTASLMLALLMWQWRPIPAVMWQADSIPAMAFGWTVHAAGFGLVFLSTFMVDHCDLFGLKQVWKQFCGAQSMPPQFTMPFLYRLVRHPLHLGFILAFWSGPVMTTGHFLFAGCMTTYIIAAIKLEEYDLIRSHGPLYEQYRKRVPMLIPMPGRRQM